MEESKESHIASMKIADKSSNCPCDRLRALREMNEFIALRELKLSTVPLNWDSRATLLTQYVDTGSFGTVWVGMDRSTGQNVVIKTISKFQELQSDVMQSDFCILRVRAWKIDKERWFYWDFFFPWQEALYYSDHPNIINCTIPCGK